MVTLTDSDIEDARLLALFHALKLEIKTGMRRSARGKATSTLIKEATRLKGNKKNLLRAFAKHLDAKGIRKIKEEDLI